MHYAQKLFIIYVYEKIMILWKVYIAHTKIQNTEWNGSANKRHLNDAWRTKDFSLLIQTVHIDSMSFQRIKLRSIKKWSKLEIILVSKFTNFIVLVHYPYQIREEGKSKWSQIHSLRKFANLVTDVIQFSFFILNNGRW